MKELVKLVGRRNDAVGSDEPAEDATRHRVRVPELEGWTFAVARSVERTHGSHRIEHVAQVGRRRGGSSSPKAIVTDWTEAVGELGLTGSRVWKCDAFEKTGSMKQEQALLGASERAVDDLSELG